LVNQFYKTRITYETTSAQELESIRNHISENMPVVTFDKSPEENSLEKIKAFCEGVQDDEFRENLQKSLDIIEECYQKYSADEVSVCYNGGKDCIVMLHLVHAHFQAKYPDQKLKSLYIKETNTYAEAELFLKESVMKYKLENVTISMPMKQALAEHLSQDSLIKGTVLGTRIGDPGSQYQKSFSPTDGDWPQIMRINPILHWRYQDVWTFLRGLSIPYPSLYDQGYTSLGSPDNTEPNPALRYADKEGVVRYHPAYKLTDGSLERQGRKPKNK
jgi:FAD synthetase